MTAEEQTQEQERQKSEMRIHLTELADTCMTLLASDDPFSVNNSVHKLRSLVGQIESSSRRCCRLS